MRVVVAAAAADSKSEKKKKLDVAYPFSPCHFLLLPISQAFSFSCPPATPPSSLVKPLLCTAAG